MQDSTKQLVDHLKARVDREKVIDVGRCSEEILVGKEKLRAALTEIAQDDNYRIQYVPVNEISTKPVIMKVLMKANCDIKEVIAKVKAICTGNCIIGKLYTKK